MTKYGTKVCIHVSLAHIYLAFCLLLTHQGHIYGRHMEQIDTATFGRKATNRKMGSKQVCVCAY